MSDLDPFAAAIRYLGLPGAMLSGSKQKPRGTEDHTIYWNACVFMKTGHKDAEQIWWGDLDVTASMEKLHALATDLGETIYATREQPWRFDGFRETMKSLNADDYNKVFAFKP